MDAGDLLLKVHQLLRRVLLDRLQVDVLVVHDLEAVLVLGNFGTVPARVRSRL
jgi:hypothetical protein